MAYKVIKTFQETKHGGHIYNIGDEYPAKGFKLVKVRVEELSSENNKYKYPFLEEIKTPKKTKE